MRKNIFLAAVALLSIALSSCIGASEKHNSSFFYTNEPVGDKHFVLVQKPAVDNQYDAYLCNDPKSYEDGLKLNDGSVCWLAESGNGASEMHDGDVSFFISQAEEILFNQQLDDKIKADYMIRTIASNRIRDIKFNGNSIKICTAAGKYISYTTDDHKKLKEVYAKTFADGEKMIATIEENAKVFNENPEETSW